MVSFAHRFTDKSIVCIHLVDQPVAYVPCSIPALLSALKALHPGRCTVHGQPVRLLQNRCCHHALLLCRSPSPDFKRKMLPQNFIEPIHKISYHLTEQIVLVLKEKYSAPVVTPAFWQIPRRDAPANPFSINSFLAHWIRCIFVSLSCIFFPAMVRSCK